MLVDRYGNDICKTYKFSVSPKSGLTLTFIRIGNEVQMVSSGVTSTPAGYSTLISSLPIGFRPIMEVTMNFPNIAGNTANGVGKMTVKPDGSVLNFSTTSNSVEKMGTLSYFTNEANPEDKYII